MRRRIASFSRRKSETASWRSSPLRPLLDDAIARIPQQEVTAVATDMSAVTHPPNAKELAMANQQPSHRAYTVIKREGQDEFGSPSAQRSCTRMATDIMSSCRRFRSTGKSCFGSRRTRKPISNRKTHRSKQQIPLSTPEPPRHRGEANSRAAGIPTALIYIRGRMQDARRGTSFPVAASFSRAIPVGTGLRTPPPASCASLPSRGDRGCVPLKQRGGQ